MIVYNNEITTCFLFFLIFLKKLVQLVRYQIFVAKNDLYMYVLKTNI